MVAVHSLWSYQNSQCDAKKYEPEMSSRFDSCPILSLSVKHNFTLVDISQQPYGNFYEIETKLILNPTWIDDIAHGQLSNYEVRWSNIQFILITPFPTALTGVRAFLSPFNETVWTILIIFCVVITLIIVVSDTEMGGVVKFMMEFLNVASILLGQVNGDCFLMFHSKKWVAVPILTVWFLGGRYLTMDNLYVGSIYSFLSAVTPPKLPDTLKTLVDSDIPVITVSRTAKLSPIIKTLHIPEYIELYKENESFTKLLEKLNNKLFFTDKMSRFDWMSTVFGNIEQSKSPLLQNGGFESTKTWGVMDQRQTLMAFTLYVKWSGDRKVIHAKDGTTPFSTISFTGGSKTFLSPIFQKGFEQLSSFGLTEIPH
ncbi:hypothetical protein Fcan01_19198 [Folsomia candida]|uniref:Uncharacterized protein n=1 Tax=Folsomia candida TaxID=158441 RepID=A0A226DQ18_FOLCA|nr:hypothetical protein Fcan01_19198 [Folsomia candida]